MPAQERASTDGERRPLLSEENDEQSKVVTWDGKEDPENPRNWSHRKKVLATFILTAIAILSYALYIYNC